MYGNLQEVIDLTVTLIVGGFGAAILIGFISWGFWSVVMLFKSIVSSS